MSLRLALLDCFLFVYKSGFFCLYPKGMQSISEFVHTAFQCQNGLYYLSLAEDGGSLRGILTQLLTCAHVTDVSAPFKHFNSPRILAYAT